MFKESIHHKHRGGIPHHTSRTDVLLVLYLKMLEWEASVLVGFS